jgi:hypothetical protein
MGACRRVPGWVAGEELRCWVGLYAWLAMSRPPEQDQGKSRWEPPTDSDLIGIPLVVGMAVALLVIALAFVFLGGWGGLIAVGVVVIAALVISYRVVTSSEN